MTALYNLRSLTPTHYQMAKFDSDFNVAAIYNLTVKGRGYACDCPAGQRSIKLKPCKHQRMMILMMGACNTNRFYDPETGSWCEPLAHDPAVIDQREVEMEIEIPKVEPEPEREFTPEQIADIEAAITARGQKIEPEPVITHLTEAEAAVKIDSLGIPLQEAIYGFTKPEPPKPSTMPIITRRI